MNGTIETKFNNGTHIVVDRDGSMRYIKKIEGEPVKLDGDKVIHKMMNNITRTYFTRPATESLARSAPNYTDAFDNGTTFIKYYNGSKAEMFNGSFVNWIIKPKYLLSDINRTDY